MSDSDGASAPPILAANRISKSFGDIPVLFSVDFDVRPGEVHAIIGENGAGKSTLMKILSGFEQPTSGTIIYDGKTGDAAAQRRRPRRMGIVLIHQELNLAEHLTVVDSIFLGRELAPLRLPRRARDARAAPQALLETLHVHVDPNARIETLSVADKQMVEIAKAISRDARVLIMDEPTAVLSVAETQTLFEQIQRLTARGVAIVFISHKLDEVMRIANRVTVLRDGQLIATVPALRADAGFGGADDGRARTVQSLSAQARAGRRRADRARGAPPRGAGRAAMCRSSCARAKSSALPGSSARAAPRSPRPSSGWRIAAAARSRSTGRLASFADVAQSLAAGIAYMTKDRKGKGLLINMGLRPNLTLLTLKRHLNWRVSRCRERAAGARARRAPLRHPRPRRLGARRPALRRQPAEADAGQDHGERARDRHHGRADARHRCRHQAADLPHHRGAGGRGQIDHPHLVGTAGGHRPQPPRDGDAGRPHRRRARGRRRSPKNRSSGTRWASKERPQHDDDRRRGAARSAPAARSGSARSGRWWRWCC